MAHIGAGLFFFSTMSIVTFGPSSRSLVCIIMGALIFIGACYLEEE